MTLAACTATPDPTRRLIRPVAERPTLGVMPFVDVLVQNRSAALLIDTGASISTLNTALARAAALPTHASSIRLLGVGGSIATTAATIKTLTVGDVTVHDLPILTANIRFPDGKLLDGVLGRDFLTKYDVLLDLPDRRIALYDVGACADPFGPNAPSIVFGARPSGDTRLLFPAELDGTLIPLELDSGANRTAISDRWAARAGTPSTALSADPTYPVGGLGQAVRTAHLHRFKSFELPIGFIANPRFGVYDGPFNVLGDDFLGRNRVWVSYKLRRLYVQPVK